VKKAMLGADKTAVPQDETWQVAHDKSGMKVAGWGD
jgi:hypothetical protein